MPSQTDYLAAVGANPDSSAEKIYAHVNRCPTVAAADTMLRKLASKGLLVAESTSPRTYSLTEKGPSPSAQISRRAPQLFAHWQMGVRRGSMMGAV